MKRDLYSIPLTCGSLWVPRLFYLASFFLLAAYYPKIGKYATYDWLGLIAVVTTYVAYFFRGKMPNISRTFYVAITLLMIGAAVTIPNDKIPLRSAFSALLLLYTLILWASLPYFIFRSWGHLRLAMGALSLSAVISVLYALGHKLLGFPTFTPVDHWGRAVGLTRHPNELGIFCGMVFPYVIALWVTAGHMRVRLLWFTAALMSLLGVLLSGSMTAAFALVAGIVVYYFLTNRKARFKTLTLGLVGIAVIMAANVVYSNEATQSVIQRLERFATTAGGKLTLEQRLVANVHALEYVEASPIQGRGYHSEVNTVKGKMIEVHNTLLRAWYDGGIFTLLAILVLFTGVGIMLIKSWKLIVTLNMVNEKPYVAAAIGAYIAFLVMMEASPVLYQRSALFPVAVAVSVLTVIRRQLDKSTIVNYFPV